MSETLKSSDEMNFSIHDMNILSFLCPKIDAENTPVLDNLANKMNAYDKELKKAEISAIKLADEGHFSESLDELTSLIGRYPDHPSPLNNRAQVYRLLHQNDSALLDLEKCIKIGEHYPLTMRQAFAQRGWIYFGKGDVDLARQDFQQASNLGNKEATKMLPRCNPYAAMCNAMLAEVMQTMYSK